MEMVGRLRTAVNDCPCDETDDEPAPCESLLALEREPELLGVDQFVPHQDVTEPGRRRTGQRRAVG